MDYGINIFLFHELFHKHHKHVACLDIKEGRIECVASCYFVWHISHNFVVAGDEVLSNLKNLMKGAAKKKVLRPQPKLDAER